MVILTLGLRCLHEKHYPTGLSYCPSQRETRHPFLALTTANKISCILLLSRKIGQKFRTWRQTCADYPAKECAEGGSLGSSLGEFPAQLHLWICAVSEVHRWRAMRATWRGAPIGPWQSPSLVPVPAPQEFLLPQFLFTLENQFQPPWKSAPVESCSLHTALLCVSSCTMRASCSSGEPKFRSVVWF